MAAVVQAGQTSVGTLSCTSSTHQQRFQADVFLIPQQRQALHVVQNLSVEEYIDINYKEILTQIRKLPVALQYAACNKFLDLVRPYFCKFEIKGNKKVFYRVRAHDSSDETSYYRNISDLTYRTDLFNIKSCGRCNGPFETVFYCSDHAFLAFCEVSRLTWIENGNRSKYYTTSVWQMTRPLNLTPVFETDNQLWQNEKISKITKNCLDTIDKWGTYKKKKQLKELHSIMGREFAKPFSKQKNSYLFSSAMAGYLLKNPSEQSDEIDGLIYSTCLEIEGIKNLGLNYVFNPLVIGFGGKIEFHAAFRSKIEKFDNFFKETERKVFKKANIYTGEIIW